MKYLLTCFFLFIFLTLLGQNRETSSLIKTGQQIPSFTFNDLEGNVKSIEDLKGKVIMISFFATWCGPCLRKLPYLQTEIYNKYKNHPNFELLIFGREHSQEEVEKFRRQKGYTFPILGDPKRMVYSKFANSLIPRSFIIDRTGKVIYSSIGFDDEDFDKLKIVLAEELKLSGFVNTDRFREKVSDISMQQPRLSM